MRNLILLLSVLTFVSCKKAEIQNKKIISEIIVTESEIYEVVNFILLEAKEAEKFEGLKNSRYKYLLEKDFEPLFNNIDSSRILKAESIFLKEDLKFIDRQILLRKDFKFNKDSIKSLEIMPASDIQDIIEQRIKNPRKTFYELYKSKFGDNFYYTIGLPVFSTDKKTVFIKFSSFGSGFTKVLKKVKGSWIDFKAGSNWIS